jgi:hypothetical protein
MKYIVLIFYLTFFQSIIKTSAPITVLTTHAQESTSSTKAFPFSSSAPSTKNRVLQAYTDFLIKNTKCDKLKYSIPKRRDTLPGDALREN